MTTGRLITTVSMLAVGLVVAGAVPALAQNTPAPQPQPAPTPPAATNAPSTNAPSPTPGTNAMPPAPTEQQGAAQPNQPPPPSTAMHHAHPMHHMAMAHARRGGQPSPTAQDAAVDRLNDMSLQAAQKGQTFTPSGTPPGT
jgi:hypothetical protein